MPKNVTHLYTEVMRLKVGGSTEAIWTHQTLTKVQCTLGWIGDQRVLHDLCPQLAWKIMFDELLHMSRYLHALAHWGLLHISVPTCHSHCPQNSADMYRLGGNKLRLIMIAKSCLKSGGVSLRYDRKSHTTNMKAKSLTWTAWNYTDCKSGVLLMSHPLKSHCQNNYGYAFCVTIVKMRIWLRSQNWCNYWHLLNTHSRQGKGTWSPNPK